MLLLLIFSMQMRVLIRLAETRCLLAQDLGAVGLWQGKDAHNLDGGTEDGCGVEHPAPRRVLDDEAADDRTDGRPDEREDIIEAERLAALLSPPAVGKDSPTDGRCAAADPTEEPDFSLERLLVSDLGLQSAARYLPEGQKLRTALTEATGQIEDKVHTACDVQNWSTAVDLGQRTDNQGSNG